MQILVITRDGRSPSEGGIRLGYLVGGFFIPVGTSQLVPIFPKLKKQKPPEPPAPIIAYAVLPVTAYADGECCQCHHYPNRTTLMETDEGRKSVIICSECGTLMRPRSSLYI